jgi:hypothetical protein
MTKEKEKKIPQKRLIITVDEPLHKNLKVQAALNSTTMNAIINRALRAYDFENENLIVSPSE